MGSREWKDDEGSPLDLDERLAASFIGKRVLVSITYIDADEEPIEQRQFHGHIVRINGQEADRLNRGRLPAAFDLTESGSGSVSGSESRQL